MDVEVKHSRMRAFEATCRSQGIRLTYQRRVILEAVLDLDDHPTADRVFETVAVRTPGISRTTVYRTLETLVRIGVITKAHHPSSVARYDARLDTHHHLVCQRCDAVIDLADPRLDELPVPDTSRFGFEVLGVSVQLRGICRGCREGAPERTDHPDTERRNEP
jgi:Fur family peroxide stress response transcriptional regulator